ncbi:putative pentatricopeptide repeat-containing protein At1g64310 [Ananas comosus]|uniref:Pentatricopeptide repeat-containing protein At1g64310 n=1 Tax=Ananas comosus TaxID=4615 RepID=A0A6P5FK03_ANACO|nr:putative pentatricopeptide repeat-containing protein At1g64310 [Ananas comosus]
MRFAIPFTSLPPLELSQVCSSLSLPQTKQLHALLLLTSLHHRHHSPSPPPTSPLLLVLPPLLRSYAAHGDLPSARHLFDQIPHPTTLLYNSIIRAHASRRDFPSASRLFAQLRRSGAQKPDNFTFACVLRACSDNSDPIGIRTLHGVVVSSGLVADRVVSSALVSAYSKLGLVDHARNVFDDMVEPDLVLWNAMISGCGYVGFWQKGLELFCRMRENGEKPDGYSLVGLISCFSDSNSLRLGGAIHGICLKSGFDSNAHVRSALVGMYSKYGCTIESYQIFKSISQPDLVTWSALITGLLQAGRHKESLTMFRYMSSSGTRPDHVLLASLLSACASVVALQHGKQIHGYALRKAIDSSITVSCALVDVYAKCGLPKFALKVFESMPKKNLVAYNTVLSCLGIHDFAYKAIELFEKMLGEGIRPDKATFSALLCACCHCGLLDEGSKLFARMRDEFSLEIHMEHYVYMVKLLSTVGKLKEAYDLIQAMPFSPDRGVWGAFLWGCCVHGHADLGATVAEKLFLMDPSRSAYRVMLSNLYASKEMWWDAKNLREQMTVQGLQKSPGLSSIGYRCL